MRKSLPPRLFSAALLLAILGFIAPLARPAMLEPSFPAVYVISDLHLGVGMGRAGTDWHPMEDFRWPNAFSGFLRRISDENPKGVQLVIAGDFLELWQHPTINCARVSDVNCGCTLDEMKSIVGDVLKAHRAEFAAIEKFLDRDSNSVTVLPGNHDAALTDDSLWQLVWQGIGTGRDRFRRIKDGVMLSADGRIAVEHGHQQSFDINSFPNWPEGVKRQCGGSTRFFRPWGENFVQALYNDVETRFPLIDNIVPESEGSAIYQRYSKKQGAFATELARFIKFNLLQTSVFQKAQGLSLDKPGERLSPAGLEKCKRCLGEEVFVIGNPLAQDYVNQGGAEGENARKALRVQLTTMSDDEATTLCSRAILLSPGGRLDLARMKPDDASCQDTLSTGIRAILDPDGALTLRSRVSELYDTSRGRLAIYIHGHTHEARLAMPIAMEDGIGVDAYNTGAFQRLMDRKFLESKKQPNEADFETLTRLTHKDLAACYSVIKVTYRGRRPEAEVRQWFMREEDDQGAFLQDCDPQCSASPANCGRRRASAAK